MRRLRLSVFCFLFATCLFSSGQGAKSSPDLGTARQAMQAGNFPKAEALLDTLVAHHAATSAAYNLLGEIRVRQQKLTEAENLFHKSLRISASPGAYENLALLEALTGDEPAAHRDCQKLLQLDPNNYNGRLLSALSDIDRSHYQEALRTLQPMRQDPDPILQALYSVSLDHTGKREEARRISTKLANSSVSAEDTLLAARLFRTASLQAIAQDWLSKASQAAIGAVIVKIADAYRRAANWEEASELYQRSLKDSPHSTSLLLALASVEERCGRHADAVRYLQDAKSELRTTDDRKAYAIACMQLHLVKEGADVLKQNFEHKDSDSETYFLLGIIQFYLGKYAAAKDCYNLALASNPGDARIKLALAYLSVQTHDYENAIPELKLALQNAQLAGLAHYYLGLIEKSKGSLSLALLEFNRAVKMRPEDPAIRVDLADAQISLGDLDGAGVNLHTALHLDAENPRAHFQNARLMTKKGDRSEAKKELALSQNLWESERSQSATQLAEVK